MELLLNNALTFFLCFRRTKFVHSIQSIQISDFLFTTLFTMLINILINLISVLGLIGLLAGIAAIWESIKKNRRNENRKF